MDYNVGQSSMLVIDAAKSGDVERIKAILEGKSQAEVESIVNSETDRCTPLIAACLRGHLDVASYLIEHCQADVEKVVSQFFDGTWWLDPLSPLHCAAREGHLELVKLLVECKANINCLNDTGQTPLMIACERNHFEIVKFLIEHGADTEVTEHGETCLMKACRSGNYAMAKCLLDCGATVTTRDWDGRTALHVCADYGHLNNLKLLLENGAEYVTDDDGVTPLLAAANSGKPEIVDYLTSTNTSKITKQDKVNALELLGAELLLKRYLGINLALKYWRLAMELRYEDEKCPLLKPASRSLLGITEANSFAELEAFSSNAEAMEVQGLLIRGRIQPHLAETTEIICEESERYKRRGDYDKCIELWLYAFCIKQERPLSLFSYDAHYTVFTSRFYDIFSFSWDDDDKEHILGNISFENALKVFQASVTEVENAIVILDRSGENSIKPSQMFDLLKIAFRTMCEIYSLKCRFRENFVESEFKSVVYRLVHTESRSKCGLKLFQMAVSSFLDNVNIEFGSVQGELIDLLLEMGADPNECDNMNDTPLHKAVEHSNIPLFELLLSRGAHLDISNHRGETPLELARRSSNFQLNLNPLKYLNLQCLSARSVRTNNIPYEGLVDKNLKIFLDKH